MSLGISCMTSRNRVFILLTCNIKGSATHLSGSAEAMATFGMDLQAAIILPDAPGHLRVGALRTSTMKCL